MHVHVWSNRPIALIPPEIAYTGEMEDGKEQSFPKGRLLYDIRAPLEYSLFGAGCFLFALGAVSTYFHRPLLESLLASFISALCFVCYYRRAVNCSYLLVPSDKLIRYERKIFGLNLGYELCKYADVVLVGVSCYRRRRERVSRKLFEVIHEYAIVLVLADGTCVHLSDGSSDFTVLSMRAQDLAQLCSAPFVPPRENYRIVVHWQDGKAVGSYEKFTWRKAAAGFGEIVFYALLGCVSAAGLYWLMGDKIPKW